MLYFGLSDLDFLSKEVSVYWPWSICIVEIKLVWFKFLLVGHFGHRPKQKQNVAVQYAAQYNIVWAIVTFCGT